MKRNELDFFVFFSLFMYSFKVTKAFQLIANIHAIFANAHECGFVIVACLHSSNMYTNTKCVLHVGKTFSGSFFFLLHFRKFILYSLDIIAFCEAYTKMLENIKIKGKFVWHGIHKKVLLLVDENAICVCIYA